MKYQSDLPPEKAFKLLKEVDGACRDVSFEGTSWEGIGRFISWILSAYSDVSAYNQDGEDTTDALLEIANEVACFGSLSIVANSAKDFPVSHLQFFANSGEGSCPFVEVSFFPDLVNWEAVDMLAFNKLVVLWAEKLNSSVAYVRLENVSWSFGDMSPNSGVLYKLLN